MQTDRFQVAYTISTLNQVMTMGCISQWLFKCYTSWAPINWSVFFILIKTSVKSSMLKLSKSFSCDYNWKIKPSNLYSTTWRKTNQRCSLLICGWLFKKLLVKWCFGLLVMCVIVFFITGYLVYYTTEATEPDSEWVVEDVRGERLSTMIRDLTPETTYYFKIRARNSVGHGPMSPTVIFRTPRSRCNVSPSLSYLMQSPSESCLS